MNIIRMDDYIIICVKPAGVLSTDEAGGLPGMLRDYLGDEKACVRTVHRLDRVVSGLMLLARKRKAASLLSEQVRNGELDKEYLAVVKGRLPETQGRFTDLLLRSREERKTYVVNEPGKDVQEAILDYRVLEERNDMSLVRIKLITGRTHQIRAQFSSRGFPLVGDRKYGDCDCDCEIALWSYSLGFRHPKTGERVEEHLAPPRCYPWSEFSISL